MKKKRKTKHIYDKYITMDNLYATWNIVRRTCKNKEAVYEFSLNLNCNLMNIYHELKNKTYIPNRYKCFMIFYPKPRLVMSQSIRDKIVNHFIANYYLIPYLEDSLIYQNVATRKNKGTGCATKLIKSYINHIIVKDKPKEIFVLKIDISKYFYNIDHKILLNKLKKDIYDKDVIDLVYLFMKETNSNYVNECISGYNFLYNTDIPLYKDNKGLSIGAVSSQFLAIYYLNELDHYIKEILKCKYYIRYMDDFIIIDTDKNKLINIKNKINICLGKLKLTMNKKSNIYRLSVGLNFLGLKFKCINGKLNLSYNKKTYYMINKRLKYLYIFDKVKYYKANASYYGYFKNIKSIKRGKYKMKTDELYNMYKDKYKDTLVIIKDGIFYRCLFDDGKILWYIFGYKYINDTCSFGSNPYNKVIDKLKDLDIGFIIVSKSEELVKYINDGYVYNKYLELANRCYNRYELELNIFDKIKKICRYNYDNYNRINNYLDKLEISR